MAFNGLSPISGYPASGRERTDWILSKRGARRDVDHSKPYAWLMEEEPRGNGTLASIATIFLTNRECPFRCLMCDLWQNTTETSVPEGAIPRQIAFGLAQLPPASQIKLYNSGSFFDPKAIPPADHPAIARQAHDFERVIVECHPAFIGKPAVDFQRSIPGQLEIAIGLETAHPEVLDRLNKRMTLTQFADAAAFLKGHGLDIRVFILVKPPFLDESKALDWSRRSIDFAFDCGASVVSLIPTRSGNGALDELAKRGQFAPPKLETLEVATDYGIQLRRGRIFADLWDLEKFATCQRCFKARRDRLRQMNLAQKPAPHIQCECLHAS